MNGRNTVSIGTTPATASRFSGSGRYILVSLEGVVLENTYPTHGMVIVLNSQRWN